MLLKQPLCQGRFAGVGRARNQGDQGQSLLTSAS